MKRTLQIVLLIAGLGFLCAFNSTTSPLTSGSYTAAGIPSNQNLIENGGMLWDRRHAGAVVTITTGVNTIVATDRWNPSFTASGSGAGNPTAQQTNVSSPNGAYVKSLTITASSSPSTSHPAGSLFNAGLEAVAGSDMADLGFGTPGALTTTVSMWAKASIALTYDISYRNSAASRSYVHDCVIGSANTWTQCVTAIPGDTGGAGTWLTGIGAFGAYFSVTVNAGSTVQTTPDAWQAGNFIGTANTSDLSNTASATFEFTGVKMERGSTATPYVEDPGALALVRLGRFYQTSAPPGVAPANGMAVAGALCIENPIANGQPGAFVSLQPPMYSALTLATYNPSAGVAGNWRNVTASSDVAQAVDPATAKGTTGFEIGTAAVTATIAQTLCIHWSADTNH